MNPYIFRRPVDGKVGTVIVVFVDDILLVSRANENEERTLSDLDSFSKSKDLGIAEYRLGYHIMRDTGEINLTFGQHVYVKTVPIWFNGPKASILPFATGVNHQSK